MKWLLVFIVVLFLLAFNGIGKEALAPAKEFVLTLNVSQNIEGSEYRYAGENKTGKFLLVMIDGKKFPISKQVEETILQNKRIIFLKGEKNKLKIKIMEAECGRKPNSPGGGKR